MNNSVTLKGFMVAAAAYMIPICVAMIAGVTEAAQSLLQLYFTALTGAVGVFFTYRGSKMGVENGGPK